MDFENLQISWESFGQKWRAEYDTFTGETMPAMEMYGMASEQVAAFLQDEGATVIDIVEDQSCGPGLRSYRYFVTK